MSEVAACLCKKNVPPLSGSWPEPIKAPRQPEPSQLKNRERAFSILRAKLYDIQLEAQNAAIYAQARYMPRWNKYLININDRINNK